MLNDSEKQAVHLAVSRFGVDGRKVQQFLQRFQQARSRGETVDLVALMQREKLLSDTQVLELRQGLESARASPGLYREDIHAAATLLPADGAAPAEDDPIQDLKNLGEYRILRRLGGGGMGSVFLGYQEGQNRQVALKVLSPALAKSPAMIDRFYREARSGAHLNHPNIVRNLSVAQDKATNLHYLVLEYVDGASALELLEKKGNLAIGDAVSIALDIGRALEHAHSRNIVHRDIKPGNILITRAGVAKLADMGLAKRTDESSHLTMARQGFGTPYYMPYEQAMNARTADSRSDIYALGATLYHLLVGEVPFPGDNSLEIVDRKAQGDFPAASQVNAKVPPALDAILSRMMARKPEDRYQTASEVIVDLERTGLAPRVPGFADPDQALQDPVVRQRLSAAGLSTQADVNLPQAGPERPVDKGEFWYVRYYDRKGQPHKVRLSAGQIQKRLQEGKLPRQTEVSAQPQGGYRPLESYPQFRAKPEARKEKVERNGQAETGEKAKSSRVLWLLIGGIAATVALVGVTIWVLVRGS
jgi:serine/threonine protein kinase